MKKIILLIIKITFLLIFAMCICDAQEGKWTSIVTEDLTQGKKLAVTDLQRYFSQVSGVIPKLITEKEFNATFVEAVIIGTEESRLIIENVDIEKYDISQDGYVILSKKIKGNDVVILASKTEKGFINSIYGLLSEMGFGFYLGSEAVPDTLPLNLSKNEIVKNPVFSIRGVLPWYNFFNSPTAWDIVDHRTFVDQLIRGGANFIGFHTYDGEPFAGYEGENGDFVWGSRLLNTSVSTWGTIPTPAQNFAYGTNKLYDKPFFGATTATEMKNDREAIIAEQNIMRQSLDYAQKRGLYTCIGFEINGDPVNDSEYKDIFIKRFNKLLDQYPSVDYIWIWQSETQGVQGFAEKYNLHILGHNLNPSSFLVDYANERRKVFKRIISETNGDPSFYMKSPEGELARAAEGARLEQFGWLAINQLNKRENAPKLVISGWGGDQRLCSAEYYEGLDKLMPKDVVFSSLDLIGPIPRVDSGYGVLSEGRQYWPIPWLENDGDQWHQQPFVHIFEGTVKDALNKGSKGILGIHWRTRDIEENFGYLMDFSWNGNLTARAYFNELARKCYAKEISNEMADIHIRLDMLGYRWVGGSGQAECATFSWGPANDNIKFFELEAIKSEIENLMPKAGYSKTRLTWLLNNIEWTLAYDKAEKVAVQVTTLLNEAEKLPINEQKIIGDNVLEIMKGNTESDLLGDSMRKFAGRISTRGEYGVLATINTKAYYSWIDLKKKAFEMAGVVDYTNYNEWKAEPKVILPRLVGSWNEDEDLSISAIILGGGDLYIHYKPISDNKWTSDLMNVTENWVRMFSISKENQKTPGLVIKFSNNKNPYEKALSDEIFITVMENIKVSEKPFPIKKDSPKKEIKVFVEKGDVFNFILNWEPVIGADYYRVILNGNTLLETATPMCPVKSIEGGNYIIEVISNNEIIAESSVIKVSPINTDYVENIDIKSTLTPNGVTLIWNRSSSEKTAFYKIEYLSLTSGNTLLLPIKRASINYDNRISHRPEIGGSVYKITPVSVEGLEGKSFEVKVEIDGYPELKAVKSISMTSVPDSSEVKGEVIFNENGAVFSNSYIEIPKEKPMEIGDNFALEFDFNANQISGMPVLISNGLWGLNGYFIQILDRKLLMRTPEGDFDAGIIEPNKDYHVKFSYNYGEYTTEVNGVLVSKGFFSNNITPASTPFTIGTYTIKEPQFFFYGSIKNIIFYGE